MIQTKQHTHHNRTINTAIRRIQRHAQRLSRGVRVDYFQVHGAAGSVDAGGPPERIEVAGRVGDGEGFRAVVGVEEFLQLVADGEDGLGGVRGEGD